MNFRLNIVQEFSKLSSIFTKVVEIPRNFFGQIPCFRSISQYWQIFHHRQTIGDISNIADTYNLALIAPKNPQ